MATSLVKLDSCWLRKTCAYSGEKEQRDACHEAGGLGKTFPEHAAKREQLRRFNALEE